VRVLLAQLAPAPGDAGANLTTLEDALRQHRDADLALFPELFLTGYEPARARERALDADGEELRRVARAARANGTSVIVGFAERTPDRTLNSVAVFDGDGTSLGTYAKTHLFGANEQAAFAPGQTLLTVEIGGARIAPLICFDTEFPEPARAVAAAGAELLVTVAANPRPYGPDQELAVRARALDNRRPHVYVNRVGEEAGLVFVGGSCVVTGTGAVVEQLGEHPELRLVDVDLSEAPEPDVDYLKHVRADLTVERGDAVALEGGEG
jgi:predicted amidohydrolase